MEHNAAARRMTITRGAGGDPAAAEWSTRVSDRSDRAAARRGATSSRARGTPAAPRRADRPSAATCGNSCHSRPGPGFSKWRPRRQDLETSRAAVMPPEDHIERDRPLRSCNAGSPDPHGPRTARAGGRDPSRGLAMLASARGCIPPGARPVHHAKPGTIRAKPCASRARRRAGEPSEATARGLHQGPSCSSNAVRSTR